MESKAETKLCTKCQEVKPLDAFFKSTKHKDGLAYHCKYCKSKISKDYYKKNKALILKRAKEFYLNNAEVVKNKSLKYRKINIEKIKSSQSIYRVQNRDKTRAAQRKRYYNNLEIRRNYSNRYAKNLADGYVKNVLKAQGIKNPSHEIIELKRLHLTGMRLVKNLQSPSHEMK